ncbi:hypothetical protein, partial [Sulfitobacter geojensis]|uniref:hypothetical protein n=1 Tax=Sulfitobacter geojensis TaxID=1342299 RepID=UPI001EEE01CF
RGDHADCAQRLCGGAEIGSAKRRLKLRYPHAGQYIQAGMFLFLRHNLLEQGNCIKPLSGV